MQINTSKNLRLDHYLSRLTVACLPNIQTKADCMSQITFNEILQLVENPINSTKKKCPCFFSSDTESREQSYLQKNSRFHLLIADIDQNNLGFEQSKSAVEKLLNNAFYVMYTTYSANDNNQKFRLIIPLNMSIKGKDFKKYQQALIEGLSTLDLEADKAMVRCNQPSNLPCIGTDGFYKFHINNVNCYFNITLLDEFVRPQIESEILKSKFTLWDLVTVYKTDSYSEELIYLFNKSNNVEDLLIKFGFIRTSEGRYKSPKSNNSGAGVLVGNENFAYSFHKNDGIAQIGIIHKDNRVLTPFALLLHYQFDDDLDKAINFVKLTRKESLSTSLLEVPLIDVKKGKVLQTIENLKECLFRIGIEIRYNVVKKVIEINWKNSTKFENYDSASGFIESECAKYNFNVSSNKLRKFITNIAYDNKYNPVVDWINQKEWDGTNRLKHFFNTVTQADTFDLSLKNSILKVWMISAIQLAFSPNGEAAQGVLVLQGKQGIGKTRWFKALVPYELGFAKDGLTLDLSDKDSIKIATSYWLSELGELDATVNHRQMAKLKAFLTQSEDTYRPVYATHESTFARQTVFAATVNRKDCLIDNTGNRRFLNIEVERLEPDHGINMQQVWAEIKVLWENGEPAYLDAEHLSLLSSSNDDFFDQSPIQESVATRYDWGSDRKYWRWMTATYVVTELTGVQVVNKKDRDDASYMIKKLNGGVVKKTNKARLLLVPPLKSINFNNG